MSFLLEHISVLVVVVPLMAAPVCMFLRNGTASWAWATGISVITFALAIVLIQHVLENGEIIYALGDWAAPWGIIYQIDEIGAFVMLIVSAMAAIALPFAKQSIEREIPKDRHYLVYCMFLLFSKHLRDLAPSESCPCTPQESSHPPE